MMSPIKYQCHRNLISMILKTIVLKSRAFIAVRFSSFAITTDGRVFCWGALWGQNSLQSISTPKLVENIYNISTVCAGNETTYFLSNDGFIYFCGIYYNKQMKIENSFKKIIIGKDIDQLYSVRFNKNNPYISIK